jgi:thiamine biosynthesis lipoprotein
MPQALDLTRREFLSGRTADGVAPVADPATPDEFDSDSTADRMPAAVPLLCLSRRAMACRFEIYLCAGDRDGAAGAAAALDEIDRLERQMTVYRDDSEVARINRLAARRCVRVERGLFSLLQRSQRLSQRTEGAFDIAAGALIKAWGFFKGPRRVPAEGEIADVLERVGMRHVALDPAARTVRFAVPGVELNLGSIGKGWALDRAAEVLVRRTGATRYLLHAGHSSMLARGGPDGDGWWVGITDPADPRRRIGRLRLRDGALSISGAVYRYFEHGGRRYGHTLDPRTGRPAEGVRMTLAAAPTAAEADALSTAFYVLGPEAARRYCRSHPGVQAIVLPDSTDGRRTDPVVLGIKSEDLEWHAVPAEPSPSAAVALGGEPEV